MRSTRHFPLTLDDGADGIQRFVRRNLAALLGLALLVLAGLIATSLATWRVEDPSLSNATDRLPENALGYPGAIAADLMMQFFGLAGIVLLLPLAAWGWQLAFAGEPRWGRRPAAAWITGAVVATGAAATLPVTDGWPLPTGLGGVSGDLLLRLPSVLLGGEPAGLMAVVVGLPLALLAAGLVAFAAGLRRPAVQAAAPAEPADTRRRRAPTVVVPEDGDDDDDEDGSRAGYATLAFGAAMHSAYSAAALLRRGVGAGRRLAERFRDEDDDFADHRGGRIEPSITGRRPDPIAPEDDRADGFDPPFDDEDDDALPATSALVTPQAVPARAKPARAAPRRAPPTAPPEVFALPPMQLLVEPPKTGGKTISTDALEQNARLLEGVLDDFGVRGEIIHVRPGPVVTLYELEPAPGIKSSRVIGLADDIARSMSAIACRVAVIPGKNAIGIELPNTRRETVFLRDLIDSEDFDGTKARLPLCLGKTIGGEAVVADLARMPHLLVAGTTGSGKSVAINTMILSLLYRLDPSQCRLIMIDPKMLELSIYEGIPHLLTPVVTDPKKAVVALKWTVREMEDRYRKMSKVGVRNIDGLNQRIAEAKAKNEVITRTVQTGFDKETGQPIYEEEELALEPMPYIVVIIDEMADLMMVAGKDIEGTVQRLAQMARAAGIHVVMATQRPSVDVITGTIKANFPTRISFQVTSKIDSRTILGEQGAEQLLGQGDMLYMMGGGRITRVHGPFVSDNEVEKVVDHLKLQGAPAYLEAITEDDGDGEFAGGPAGGGGDGEGGEESNDLYDQAVAVVLRDRKVSTSYIQRRLSIGYNRAASIIERMEKEGLVGAANHAGKREILVEGEEDRF